MRPLTKSKLITLALGVLVLPCSAAVMLGGFRNGSFDQQLDGWKSGKMSGARGMAVAGAEVTAENGRPHGGGDGTAAVLSVWGQAGATDGSTTPGSKAFSLAHLDQRIANIPSTHLSFDWDAGFGGTLFSTGTITYEARVLVKLAGPHAARQGSVPIYEQDLLSNQVGPLDPCANGIAFDGRAFGYHHLALDLAEAGFRRGDDILVSIEFDAKVSAPNSCDFAEFSGSVWVDHFFVNPPKIRSAG